MRKALVLTGLAGLLALTGCGTKDADGSNPAKTSPATTTASADPSTLGPDGYGGIKLGDSVAEVKAAGLDVSNADSPCLATADIKGPKGYASVLISAKDGVYVISARDPEPTPEGIKLGSTLAEVTQAYPQATSFGGGVPKEGTNSTAVPGNPRATYQIYIKNGKVDQLELRLADCTG